MTYAEQAAELAINSSVAVQVLLSDTPGACEFVPLKPKAADAEMWAELKTRWPGRNLRSVGVIGLVGTTPQFALKEPLEPEQVSALARAFFTHLDSLFRESFAAQIEAAADVEPEYDWAARQYRLVPRGRKLAFE